MINDVRPFRIAGSFYYIGDSKDASHLIVTTDGLILIDTPRNPDSAQILSEHIIELGFSVDQLKYILVTHGHFDHYDGVRELVSMSGAKTCLGEFDIALNPGFIPDILLRDGDEITLGNVSVTCLHTPGHTVGALSFFFDVMEDGETYRVGMFGGAGIPQVSKQYLDKHDLLYHQRGDFYRSLDRLRSERVDIFIGNHPGQSYALEKAKRAERDGFRAFVDPLEWNRFMDDRNNRLDSLIHKESREFFVNYAHRGASTYCPENTLMAFYTGLYMGANGIETDVQLTKDGIPVLFHDKTVERVTNGAGIVSDLSLEELLQLDVINGDLRDKIVTLEDFLQHFANQDITFAIELKGEGVEAITAELIYKYGIERKCVVTSFKLAYLENIHRIAPKLKLGYLSVDVEDAQFAALKRIGCDEFCPKATFVTAESVEKWHKDGFRVRAWGVKDEALMRQVYDSGADGMTVNFPDKLTSYISEQSTTG